MGNGVRVQNNVSIYGGVILEDHVFVGPSVVFSNDRYPRAFIPMSNDIPETRVCHHASLGANCTLVCPVQIGEFAMVGAGSVVVKNVPPFALVVGNPARQIGWVNEAGKRVDEQPKKK